jgi:hypothetical protein
MNGWNSYSKYRYPLFTDIMDALRPQLEKENLFLSFHIPFYEVEKDNKNKAQVLVQARVQCPDTYETFTVDCPGYSEDSNDKAVFQAITGAKKYAALNLFGINAGDDPESTPSPQELERSKNNNNSGNKGKQAII